MIQEINRGPMGQIEIRSGKFTLGFESIINQPFVKSLGKTTQGLDYAGSCDCDAGPCYNCNCNCVIGCT